MKAKFIQRMMASALAVALVAAPSMSVLATSDPVTGTADPVTGGSESVIAPVITVEEEVVAIINQSIGSSESNGGGSSISSIAEIPVTNTVAGVTSTVQGVYIATSVNGTAITSSLAGIASSYGLAAGEVPFARFSNMDVKKSNLAKAVIDNAAAAIGATVGPCINIEIGKKAGGKFSLLSQDGENITIMIGIPKSFAQDGKTFAMVCVRPGGAVSILQDTDTNPNTITFDTKGGQGAYAIIKY